MARLVALETSQPAPRTLGLGKGRFTLPENFDALAADEIRAMFEGAA